MATSNFEYVFLFLFRTKLPTKEGELVEPLTITNQENPKAKSYGMPFDSDKRLFLRDPPAQAKLVDWEQHLQDIWQKLLEFYTKQFGSEEQAKYYCHNALLGVALLILDDGDSIERHKVHVQLPKTPSLEFKKSGNFLFSISDEKDVQHKTACYSFQHPKIGKNLRLSLTDKPQFAPMQHGEFAANSIFLVCGFSFGGDERQKNAIERLLITTEDGKDPLLAEIFTRLITEQWKFRYVDEIARTLRSNLKPVINKYNNYIVEEIDCTRTGTLENHLQEMQSSQNEAHFLLSSINGAIQTLDINAYNLANRLEQIRQLAAKNDWHIYFNNKATEPLVWSGDKKSNYEEPLLAIFQLHIKNLKDHKGYLQQQIDQLNGLQARWQLYLGKRRSLSGEHLNTLISFLIIMLAGGSASFTINRGAFGFDINKEQVLFWVIIIVLLPVAWHFLGRFFKLLCCVCHGTKLYNLCGKFTNFINSIKFFSWFKR